MNPEQTEIVWKIDTSALNADKVFKVSPMEGVTAGQ